MSSDNMEIVAQFCAAWATRDVEQIVGFVTEDCFYHNIPIDPVTGKDAIRTYLKPGLDGAQEIEFRVMALAEAADGAVLTERLDRFRLNGNWVELPVMGIFELKDGKIASWRDYFDLNQFNSRMAAALA